ncbi:ABC transporter ATP-binding protein [Halorussus caseinilyticus]|uniref:ABC transporter ATP-binding protein n=1 Tax=Halorussus caseinilyticus TaxID=3034025 RepID=UPI0023E78AF7|nr:ABC transporter ATP-binding protein [Halorussus sp. DT72]
MTDRTHSERPSDRETDESDDRETAESSERTTVLDVAGLGHSFGEVDVFSDLTFSVESGTVTALVGPNGSGKTTLLRAVLGLLEPDEGSVSLAAPAASDDGTGGKTNETTGEKPTAETGGKTNETTGREVGYLPQSPTFRPAFTVAETLRFYADLLDREVDVSAVVERVGLSEASDRRVETLSGGMTRLLGVGQAILGDPPIVVLDEPTGDLDPRMTEYIFDLVADLADDGMAVLLATHNLSGAEEADTVLLLDHGDVVADGSPDDFVARTDADTFRGAFLELTGGTRPDAADETTAPTVSVRTQGDE